MIAGNAPAAVQLKGPEIAEWNATGKTANLDELAAAEGWDAVVAPELLPVMKPEGAWVAAPMNIHRINWLWGSPKAMADGRRRPSCRRPGRSSTPPATRRWRPARSASRTSSADWTDATTFEVVVYGQDIDLYRKAFVEGDPEALRERGHGQGLRAVPA